MSYVAEQVRDGWLQLAAAGREVVTPPAGAVVSLSDIKAHVRQTLSDDDAQLESLSLAAGAQIEAFTGRAVLAQTRRVWFDEARGFFVLPEPVNAVTVVTAYDTADAATVVASTVYQVDAGRKHPRVSLRQGQVWPSGLRQRQAVAVTYTAGWSAVDVPWPVRHAALLLVAHWYAHDEPVADRDGRGAQPWPYGIDHLLMPYRVRTGVA